MPTNRKPVPSGRFGDETDDWADAEPLVIGMGERILFRPGVVLIGEYVGTQVVEVDSDTAKGEKESVTYVLIESKDGKRYNFSPAYQVREALEECEVGDTLRIECTGEQSTRRGLNPVKLFTVKRRPKA